MPSRRLLLNIILPLLTLFAGVVFYNHGSPPVFPVIGSFTRSHTSSLTSPHAASWQTWYHPHRSGPLSPLPETSRRGWNILHHLGGNGPWIERAEENGEQTTLSPPEGCAIDQVHLMARHAERYPTPSAGERHLQFLDRIKSIGLPLNGSLAFLNNWTYITDDPSRDLGQLTSTGPYAGTLGALTTGVRFRTRYGNLLPTKRTRLWASDSERVIETARLFASGVFGLDWESAGKAELQIIPETFERGADTLTPGDTCHKYLEDTVQGHDNGMNMLEKFQDAYIPAIAKRLIMDGNTGLGALTSWEVYSMQEMCGFEIMVRGSSPWCEVFSEQEWNHFEYARDLIHYYRAGPGNPYAGAMGWLWLNATAALLHSGPNAGTLFLSFVHDGDIAPFLTTLKILSADSHIPATHVVEGRVWRTSSVMPMGARVTIERLTCDRQPYIRVNINDRVIPLPYCKSGPGGSCALEDFAEFVRERKKEVGDFGEICGLEGHVGGITFLRQD